MEEHSDIELQRSEEARRYRMYETLTGTLYDYETVPAGAEKHDFFSRPLGVGESMATRKTRFDTNLYLANCLPTGIAFSLHEIEVAYLANTRSEYERFGASGSLEFNVLDKNYFSLAPLGRFMRPWDRRPELLPPPPGVPDSIESVPWTHGPFKVITGGPLNLLANQPFGVTLLFGPERGRKLHGRVGVVFHGILQRSAS